MLILVLIDVQYLENNVSSLEEGPNGQNQSPSDTHHPIKNWHQQNFPSRLFWGIPPTPQCHLENNAKHIIEGLNVNILLNSEL